MLRLGASFETPTWYYIEEETVQRLETFSEADGVAVVNPNVVNIFPEYQFRTPAKATGSIAILFGKEGLISFDYSYKDYTTMKFDSDNGADFSQLNRDIDENLQASSTIRIGGEWRAENWSFRGGYSYEESPYKNELILGEKEGVSFGVGYNFGKVRFDFAYDYTEQQRSQQFFPDSGFTNAALIDSYRDNFTFTVALNL